MIYSTPMYERLQDIDKDLGHMLSLVLDGVKIRPDEKQSLYEILYKQLLSAQLLTRVLFMKELQDHAKRQRRRIDV